MNRDGCHSRRSVWPLTPIIVTLYSPMETFGQVSPPVVDSSSFGRLHHDNAPQKIQKMDNHI